MSAITQIIEAKNANLNCSPVSLQELWYIDDVCRGEVSYLADQWFKDAISGAFKKLNPNGKLTLQLKKELGEKVLQFYGVE